ncbi:hypothetical protein ACFV0O_03300 [Kitasatospora sp. NPDC059577]
METNGEPRPYEVLVAGPYFTDPVFHGPDRPVARDTHARNHRAPA